MVVLFSIHFMTSLVLWQLLLTAGTAYVFSITARAQDKNYPERFEVKAALSAGKTATAAQLSAGEDVIAATDLNHIAFQAYCNDEFTVAESGYYFIGVHAISDADKYYLSVDDFSIAVSTATGIEEITAGVKKAFDAYSLDGRFLRQQTNNMDGLKGVYIIDGKAILVK